MTHWTFEDSLKLLVIGAVSISFLIVDGPALAERLNLGTPSPEASAAADPQEAAHQQALSLEQQYPMLDVLGYGHGTAKGIPMTFVLFGVVDPKAIQSREPEMALALMQFAGRLAEETSQALVVVHFSFTQGVVTGEFNCPKEEFATYDDMLQGDCVASLYPPDERSPLPPELTQWEGVGK